MANKSSNGDTLPPDGRSTAATSGQDQITKEHQALPEKSEQLLGLLISSLKREPMSKKSRLILILLTAGLQGKSIDEGLELLMANLNKAPIDKKLRPLIASLEEKSINGELKTLMDDLNKEPIDIDEELKILMGSLAKGGIDKQSIKLLGYLITSLKNEPIVETAGDLLEPLLKTLNEQLQEQVISTENLLDLLSAISKILNQQPPPDKKAIENQLAAQLDDVIPIPKTFKDYFESPRRQDATSSEEPNSTREYYIDMDNIAPEEFEAWQKRRNDSYKAAYEELIVNRKKIPAALAEILSNETERTHILKAIKILESAPSRDNIFRKGHPHKLPERLINHLKENEELIVVDEPRGRRRWTNIATGAAGIALLSGLGYLLATREDRHTGPKSGPNIGKEKPGNPPLNEKQQEFMDSLNEFRSVRIGRKTENLFILMGEFYLESLKLKDEQKKALQAKGIKLETRFEEGVVKPIIGHMHEYPPPPWGDKNPDQKTLVEHAYLLNMLNYTTKVVQQAIDHVPGPNDEYFHGIKKQVFDKWRENNPNTLNIELNEYLDYLGRFRDKLNEIRAPYEDLFAKLAINHEEVIMDEERRIQREEERKKKQGLQK